MRSHPALVRFLTAITFVILSNPLTAQQVTTDRQLASLFTEASKLGTFNGNVLIAEKGKIVYLASHGVSDTTRKVGLTLMHRFHIGSIAKEFNAVAIMMLEEKGKLKLEDKLGIFFPSLPAWANQVSVKNLLQYTSGIPDVKWKTVKNDSDNWNNLMVLDTLDFEPGTRYNYNNNNVFLQRRIVEKITGMSFSDFVINKMLKPLGIVNAVIDPTESDTEVARAFSNSGSQDPLVVPISGWTALTIQDFYVWATAIRDFKLINATSTSKIISGFEPGNQSGLGGGLIANGKMLRHVHDGTARNYQALLADYPDKQRTILLMTNNQQNNLPAIEKSVISYLDGGNIVPVRKSLLRDVGGKLDSMDAKAFLQMYDALKKEKPGTYSFGSETTLNEVGYAYLSKKKSADAILVFEYNTRLFPTSGNVFDSLGDAYYNSGNKAKALENYKRALELDPANQTAQRIVKELQ